MPIDYSAHFTTTYKPASPDGSTRPPVILREKVGLALNDAQVFNQTAHFSEFMKDKEFERNRKFIRRLAREIRKKVNEMRKSVT
jgi:hypothetical protein